MSGDVVDFGPEMSAVIWCMATQNLHRALAPDVVVDEHMMASALVQTATMVVATTRRLVERPEAAPEWAGRWRLEAGPNYQLLLVWDGPEGSEPEPPSNVVAFRPR